MLRSLRRRWPLILATMLSMGCQGDRALPSAPVEPGSAPRTNTANAAPTALFTVSPRWPRPGDTVTVDASYSLDRDGSIVGYEWNLGNGATQVTGARARTVYTRAGSFPVSVTVVDDSGGRSTRSLSLAVSNSGAPPTAVDSAQSLVTAASSSLLAAASTLVTVTARNALGVPVANVPVWLSGRAREWRVTQPTALSSALGVATGSVGSPVTQSAQLLAIADYTLLRSVAMNIGATALEASRSSVRLTDPVVAAAGDSTLLEVTARDAEGNPLAGATVTVTITGGTSTVRNEGATDAGGRRTIVIEPTTCGGATLTVTAHVNGTPLPVTPSVTAAAPATYGACGPALWLDAADASTVTQSGGVLTGWQDKSGAARHSTAANGPSVIPSGFNGRTALRFNGTNQFVPITDVASGSAYTLVVVERRRSGRSANFVIGGTSAVALSNVFLGYLTGTGLRFANGIDQLDVTVPAFTTEATEPGRVLIGHWTSGQRNLFINGALVGGDASASALLSWAGAAIGRVNAGGTLTFFDGDVGEVLLFRRALSAAERTTLNNGLMAKWSLGTLGALSAVTQSGAVGSAAPTPPRVRVTTPGGTPLAGATVTWQVVAGSGTVNTVSTTTDGSGEASVTWVLGSGANTLRAAHGTSSVDFTATAGGVCVSVTICDPALWVDATDASTITTSAGAVTEWRDKSGWGRHFSAVASSAPSVQMSPLTFKNMLRFDGTDVMSLANRTWPGTGAYTLVVVERRRSGGASAFFGRSAPSADPVPILGYSSSTAAYVSHGSNPLSGAVSAFTTATVQGTRVWSVQYANGTRRLRINNAVVGTDDAVGSVMTFSGATLGRHDATWYNGDIGEVVLIPRAVSDADLQAYTLSLMAKWTAGVLTIEAGNAQTANAGTTATTAPRIRLSDGNGNGVAGAVFNWQVTDGGGRVANQTFTQGMTNATGFADVPPGGWRLDNGTNQLTVWQSLTNGEGPSVVFSATGQLPATPRVHFDAQDASSFTLNGSNVSQWRDRAGSTRTVGQSAPGQQPTRGASVINGRPAVVFDGSNDFLIGNNVAYGITGARSVFIVTRTTATPGNGGCNDGNGQYLIDRDPSAMDSPLTSIKAVNGRWVVQTRLDNNSGLGCVPSSGGVAIANNATTIFSMVQNATSISVWGNGTSAGSALMFGTNTMQPISIGRHGNQGSNPSLTGAVAEVIVFPSALSTADRQIVERYLGWKWGVTVP